MLRVALTGGIATGKSLVGRTLRALGLPVVDADQVARDVVTPGAPALVDIVARFGRTVLAEDGSLDRSALARLVFADAAARLDLEAIVHPEVRRRVDAFLESASARHDVAVAEIPLLYETGRHADFDVVVVTACAPETQRVRLAARDDLTEPQVRSRLAAQWPTEDKARLADAVVITDGPVSDTEQQVHRLVAWLRGRQ